MKRIQGNVEAMKTPVISDGLLESLLKSIDLSGRQS
jgi:hypothetical protein